MSGETLGETTQTRAVRADDTALIGPDIAAHNTAHTCIMHQVCTMSALITLTDHWHARPVYLRLVQFLH
jgi:hypothetical protein